MNIRGNNLPGRITWLLVLINLLISIPVFADSSKKAKDFPPGLEQVGYIAAPAIKESSGIIGSHQFTNVFWTHNDSGNAAILFAIKQTGELIAQFAISGGQFEDWEDIAADGKGNLFLGDIGNNDAERNEFKVHQIVEPNPESKQRSVTVNCTWTLKLPEKPFDCESLFIYGTNGYVVSKVFKDEKASLYSFPLGDTDKAIVLKWIAQTEINSPVTAADLSVDGSLLGLVAKSGAYVYRVDGDFGRIGNNSPFHVPFKGRHIEACTFVRDGLLVTAESREIYLFKGSEFRTPAKP